MKQLKRPLFLQMIISDFVSALSMLIGFIIYISLANIYDSPSTRFFDQCNTFSAGIAYLGIICVLVPINSFYLIILHLSKLLRYNLYSYWYIIIESVLYVYVSLIFGNCDLPKGLTIFLVCFNPAVPILSAIICRCSIVSIYLTNKSNFDSMYSDSPMDKRSDMIISLLLNVIILFPGVLLCICAIF